MVGRLGGPLLPAWIRAFFQNEAFTSRSLELTVLDWAARHGMTPTDRRTLGYHVKPRSPSTHGTSCQSLCVRWLSYTQTSGQSASSRTRPDRGTGCRSRAVAPRPTSRRRRDLLRNLIGWTERMALSLAARRLPALRCDCGRPVNPP